jgi:hypothetical protein
VTQLSETGSRAGSVRNLLAVAAAALATVACLHLLPVLSFFFAVPLFILYFTQESRLFMIYVVIIFALNAFVTFALQSFGGAPTLANFGFSVAGSAFFILPVLASVLPGVRLRYRVSIAGLVASLSWTVFVLASGTVPELAATIRSLSDETLNMLYQMIPEGYERAKFQASLGPDSFYAMLSSILLYCIAPAGIVLYSLNCRLALLLVCRTKRQSHPAFKVAYFSCEPILFLPLVLGMAGIMIGKLAGHTVISVLSWNLAISAGLFFAVQGAGILFFFLGLLRRKTGLRALPVALLAFILFLPGGWLFCFTGLLIAGVVELFVPLRARFDNKNSVDPTPGNDTDRT